MEALDDLGLRPSHVTGTSIGAILGAACCAGLTGGATSGTRNTLHFPHPIGSTRNDAVQWNRARRAGSSDAG
ncbi:MAG: hypothetical protein H6883_01875 [Rhodobiaceae bacterium]|nr:hypothetical protein [Rhodobiaceae bacterium]